MCSCKFRVTGFGACPHHQRKLVFLVTTSNLHIVVNQAVKAGIQQHTYIKKQYHNFVFHHDQGDTVVAVKELRALVEAMKTQATAAGISAAAATGTGFTSTEKRAAAEVLAGAMALCGKWMARTQYASNALGVMTIMGEAATLMLTPGNAPLQGKTACRVFYRLAKFADDKYR